MKEIIDRMTKDISMDMFGMPQKHERGVRNVLVKLGIKTAVNISGAALMIESLDATLKMSTFNADHLKLWNK